MSRYSALEILCTCSDRLPRFVVQIEQSLHTIGNRARRRGRHNGSRRGRYRHRLCKARSTPTPAARNDEASVVEHAVKEFDITSPFRRTKVGRTAYNHASTGTQSAFATFITIVDYTGRRPRAAAQDAGFVDSSGAAVTSTQAKVTPAGHTAPSSASATFQHAAYAGPFYAGDAVAACVGCVKKHMEQRQNPNNVITKLFSNRD